MNAEARGRGSRRASAMVLAVVAAAAVAQEPTEGGGASRPTSRTLDVGRVVERANHVNPYVAVQAVKALESVGAAALPEIEAFVARRSIYALSAPFTTWLGRFDDPRARALLRRAADDPEFPWRPFAVRALTERPHAEDAAAFRRLLSDRLAPVREASAAGLAAIAVVAGGDAVAEAAAALKAAAGDPSFDVRAGVAEALRRLGDESGLPVMVDALALSRRFFDLDFGEIARRRAWAFVEPAVGGRATFDPGAPAAVRRGALAEVRAALGRAEGVASRPTDDDVDDVIFGLEVRSCRRGDEFLRVTAGGDLVVGQYDLRRARLSPEAASAFAAALVLAKTTNPGPWYGRPGCDFERYYLPDEDGLKKITVGIEGRPAPLRRLSGILFSAVRDGFGPAVGAEHEERVAPYAAGDEDPESEAGAGEDG